MPLDCVAIGDTIAIGLGNALQCAEVRAAANLNSSRIINISNGNDKYHEYCIISAGSYDNQDQDSTLNLLQIRRNTVCKFYVWVLPQNYVKASQVFNVSRWNRDYTITYRSAGDGITPLSYKDMANDIINRTNN